MSVIQIFANKSNEELSNILTGLGLDENIKLRILSKNNRVEFIESEESLFIILYLPEYLKKQRVIETVEVNILFNLKTKESYFFVNNSEYFFEKYKSEFGSINFKSFGGFVEKFISIVFEDLSRMIGHILSDTSDIRREYSNSQNNYSIIRNLTNNQINISNLKLIFANLNKLVELLNDYMNKTQQSSIHYRINYLQEELSYALEFCQTLMSSINTKFQVKSSDDLYRFTKYSFITFVSTLALTLIIILRDSFLHKNFGFDFFFLSLISVAIIGILVLIFFRNRE